MSTGPDTAAQTEGIAVTFNGQSSTRLDLLAVRDILQHEVDYRRQRRSSVFTWVNTLLIAITGGVVALQMQTGQSMSRAQQVVFSLAVVVLSTYSAMWWEKQRRIGSHVRVKLDVVDAQLGVPTERQPTGIPDQVGGRLTIVLLAVAAVTAIWLPVR